MGVRERRIEPDRLQQEAASLVLLPVHPVKLRQMIIRTRIRRLPRDPRHLLVHLAPGLVVEREIDHFLAPKAHSSSIAKLLMPLRNGNPVRYAFSLCHAAS